MLIDPPSRSRLCSSALSCPLVSCGVLWCPLVRLDGLMKEDSKVMDMIVQELTEAKAKHAVPRRTLIKPDEGESLVFRLGQNTAEEKRHAPTTIMWCWGLCFLCTMCTSEVPGCASKYILLVNLNTWNTWKYILPVHSLNFNCIINTLLAYFQVCSTSDDSKLRKKHEINRSTALLIDRYRITSTFYLSFGILHCWRTCLLCTPENSGKQQEYLQLARD